MKKTLLVAVAAFIAGALVMTTGQVMADSLSRVGKKVGSEAMVLLNGKQLSDAVVIDKKSYLPVRDIAEAFGAEVTYEAATKDKSAVIELITSTDGSEIPVADQIVILQQQKAKLATEKEQIQEGLPTLKKSLAGNEEMLKGVVDDLTKVAISQNIESKKKAIEDIEKRLAEIDAEIAEIDAQIAKLKK